MRVYAYRGTVQDDERELLFDIHGARQYAIDLLMAANEAASQSNDPVPQSDKRYSGAAEGRLSRFFRTLGHWPWSSPEKTE